MKYLIYNILILININAFGQKKISKNIDLNTYKSIVMDLRYAKNIVIKTGEGKQIQVIANVNLDDNKYNDNFELVVKKNAKEINITSQIDNLDEVLEKKVLISPKDTISKKMIYTNGTVSNKGQIISRTYLESQIDYEIIMPEDIDFSLESIASDVQCEYNGGNIKLKSISGNIAFSAINKDNLDLKFKTLQGDVYTNLSLNLPENKELGLTRVGGGMHNKFSQATLNKGGKQIIIESVTGDIFLREISY